MSFVVRCGKPLKASYMTEITPIVPIQVREYYIQKVVNNESLEGLEKISLRFCEKTIQKNPELVHFDELVGSFERMTKAFKVWVKNKNPNLFPSHVFEKFFSQTMEVFYLVSDYAEHATAQAKRTLEHVFGRCFWIIKELEIQEL